MGVGGLVWRGGGQGLGTGRDRKCESDRSVVAEESERQMSDRPWRR